MSKILKIGLLIVVGILITALNKNEEYFEGEIHYDIEYNLKTDKTTLESLKLSTGSKMIMLFKNGDFYKKIYNSNNKLIEERMLILKNNKYYRRRYDKDTITWFDITKNDSPTTFKIKGTAKLLNQECTIVDSETNISYYNIHKTLKERYVYSNELKTNPKWYEKFKEGNFNEISEKLNCIVLELNSDIQYYDRILKAISINKRKISDEEFGFELKNKPLKQI